VEGRSEIWLALRSAVENASDPELSAAIIEGAAIKPIVPGNLEACYDERGALYEVPNFCLIDPTNLVGND
jgi:hypothetical protein